MVRAVMAMNPNRLIPSPPARHCPISSCAVEQLKEAGKYQLLPPLKWNGRSDPISLSRKGANLAQQQQHKERLQLHKPATFMPQTQVTHKQHFDDITMGSPKHVLMFNKLLAGGRQHNSESQRSGQRNSRGTHTGEVKAQLMAS